MALYLYVAPHLDDVVLSAGGLVDRHVRAGHEVRVASLCTADPPEARRLSPLAAQFHEKWGAGPEPPYEERRREDQEACAALGARARHLNLPDAIYRGNPTTGQYACFESLFGDVPAWDRGFANAASAALRKLVTELAPAAVFGPLAAGRNVDHQHTLQSLWLLREELGAPLWLYEDQPYAAGLYPRRSQGAVAAAVRACPFALRPEIHAIDFAAKRTAICCYRSQLDELFGAELAGLDTLEAYARSLGPEPEPAERVWLAENPQD